MIARRRLFGLLAAPAIISITGRLQPALIVPPASHFIVPELQPLVDPIMAANITAMDAHKFRALLEPGLREMFAHVFDGEQRERLYAAGFIAWKHAYARGEPNATKLLKLLREKDDA